MEIITINTKVAGHGAFVHCLKGTENSVLESLDSFTKFNGGIDNLTGSDCYTANIHFVHQDKLAQAKEFLNKMVLLQPEDIADDDDIEEIFHYLEFPCKDSPYSILIYNEGVINDNAADYENDFDTISECMEEISNLSDCDIFAGAEYNDYYLFHIMAYHLLPKLKHIDCSDLQNAEDIESIFGRTNDQADYMSINKDNPTLDDSIHFYKLIMENLLLDSVKSMESQGYSIENELYVYEKVKRYLKN